MLHVTHITYYVVLEMTLLHCIMHIISEYPSVIYNAPTVVHPPYSFSRLLLPISCAAAPCKSVGGSGRLTADCLSTASSVWHKVNPRPDTPLAPENGQPPVSESSRPDQPGQPSVSEPSRPSQPRAMTVTMPLPNHTCPKQILNPTHRYTPTTLTWDQQSGDASSHRPQWPYLLETGHLLP